MTREPVTVTIPVGPEPSHREWLDEAVQSVLDQAEDDDRVLLMFDGPPFSIANAEADRERAIYDPKIHRELIRWRVGVASAFNIGIGTDQAGWDDLPELVIMLGSDDLLLPGAIDACVQTWEDNDRADAYYWMSIEYGDDREDKIQALPCNAAMVTRAFWRWSGGFPVETASGAPDAALVSMLMVHAPERLIAVQQGVPLQWVRVHEGQDTAGRAPWQGVIHQTRDILTKRGFPS